ncbi:hypothetical protein [Bradyrhizobium sp. SZCCHNRI1009]|uniref:hypothetical protein n=1 Tax=Bradyrhizobium sp. SZCCHNRI1009 TaxID=3057277 RepID=UPI002916358D|nr:hypothetical protein [Bradyrhizobium sp. SZCCHNRI1009]
MLARSEKERTKLLVVTDADMRSPKADALEVAHKFIFDYIRSKFPDVPNDLFARDSFDSDAGLVLFEHIQHDNFEMWALRLNEPDSTIPGRSWHLEITTARTPSSFRFGSRLSCFSRNFDFEFAPAVPRVYRRLASQGILHGDGTRLTDSPVDVSNDDDVDWLLALLNNPDRWRNIIAIAVDERGMSAIDPFKLSDKLCGTAHVVRIFPPASFLLSDKIEKYLSVFDYGIRIYRPTNNITEDEIYRHTLFTKQHISRLDKSRLLTNISLDAFRASVERNLQREAIPTFAKIRSASATLRLESARKHGRDSTSLEEQLNAALAAKRASEAQAEEALALSVQEETERIQAEAERDQERARSAAMSARIRALEDQLQSLKSSAEVSKRPANYHEMIDWIQSEFAGRLQLTGKAQRGLRDSRFSDINLVCDVLELLATLYVDSRRGTESVWHKFDEEIKKWGIEFSRSISGNRAGEEGDEYFVKHRGQKRFLEWHLKKGNSRDPRRDLRIYFFWDEEDEEVVLGYLTGHLDNRLT